jgi:L-amino acid N-acyltransferase YncA
VVWLPVSGYQLPMLIEAMIPADWDRVRAIYEQGIASRQATFETVAPDWATWDAKYLGEPRLVVRDPDVVGWAALSRVSAREVYRGVCEVSVYVDENARGRGIGRILLDGLVKASEEAGIWTLQAGIFPENEASVNLHLRHGFRVVGRREKIAQHHGVWRDTLLLERRSSVV